MDAPKRPSRGLLAKLSFGLVPLVGAAAGLQAALNSHLGAVVGSGAFAAVICYSLTFVLMLAVAFTHARRSGRAFFRLRPGARLVWYEWLGGVAGAVGQLAAVYLTNVVGVAMLFALVVAGQLCASVALDHTGFLGLQKSPATAGKLVSLAIALAGVAAGAAVAMTDSAAGHQASGGVPGYAYALSCVAVLVGGCAGPVQAVMNWRLGRVLPHKLQALLVSITVAATIAGIVTLVVAGAQSAAGADGAVSLARMGANASHAPWWAFAGCACMLVTLTGGAVFPAKIGAAVYYGLLLVGELSSSLILDATGACGLDVRPATAPRILSVLLVAAGSLAMKQAHRLDAGLQAARAWLACRRGGGGAGPLRPYLPITSASASSLGGEAAVGYPTASGGAGGAGAAVATAAALEAADKEVAEGAAVVVAPDMTAYAPRTPSPRRAMRAVSWAGGGVSHGLGPDQAGSDGPPARHSHPRHHQRGHLSLCNSFMGVGALLTPGEGVGVEYGEGGGEEDDGGGDAGGGAFGSWSGGLELDMGGGGNGAEGQARDASGAGAGVPFANGSAPPWYSGGAGPGAYARRHTDSASNAVTVPAGIGLAYAAVAGRTPAGGVSNTTSGAVQPAPPLSPPADDGYRRRLLSGGAGSTPGITVAARGDGTAHGAVPHSPASTRKTFGFPPASSRP